MNRKPNTTKFFGVVYFLTWKFPDLQYSAIAQVRYSDCCQFCSPFLAAIVRLITLSSTICQDEQAKIVLLPDNVQLSAKSQRNFSSNHISVPSFSMVVNCGGCGQWSWLKLQSLSSVMFCWCEDLYLQEFPLYCRFCFWMASEVISQYLKIFLGGHTPQTSGLATLGP